MDKTLEQYADHVKDKEYKDLFPDTPVEKARNDKEKVKEALFQVHHMLYNQELYSKVHGENSPSSSTYHISQQEVEKCLTRKEMERFKKQIGAATIVEEDGKTMIPKIDVQDVLSARKELRD